LCPAQNPQVLGDRRLAHPERRGEVGSRPIAAAEHLQHPPPRGIGDGAIDRIGWRLIHAFNI
jgi:hypothetical protein